MAWRCTMNIGFFLLLGCYGVVVSNPPNSSTEEEPVLWRCPRIEDITGISCSCDDPHTMRCRGRVYTQPSPILNLTKELYQKNVSLLDLSIHNLKELPSTAFLNLPLLGLIISTGGLISLPPNVFEGLENSLGALGLPSNKLLVFPSGALNRLRHLQTLDVSDNSIQKLGIRDFITTEQLQELSLAGNGLHYIPSGTFKPLKKLRVLNISRNKLNFSEMNEKVFYGLGSLEQINLQSNSLEGILPPEFLAPVKNLKSLDLSHNFIKRIPFGALANCKKLLTLNLNYNKIEVIEDHAFRNLSALHNLYLSHNNIVAISGWSLGHLSTLIELSLADNALFGITGDLLHQLPHLESLDVSANDISLLQPYVFNYTLRLKHLNIADNPLTCDCLISWFREWLDHHPLVGKEDKASAICATPPQLANAPLIELKLSDLTCQEKNSDYYHEGLEEYEEGGFELRISNAEINLQGASWLEDEIQLVWTVDDRALPYTCQAIHIYELQTYGDLTHQLLTQKLDFTCNSDNLPNPHQLTITIPADELKQGGIYRYCLVLIERGTGDDEGFLPGCSEALPLVSPTSERPSKSFAVTSLTAGIMGVDLIVQTKVNFNDEFCSYNLYVVLGNAIVTSRELNCTEKRYSFSDLVPGQYTVCVTLDSNNIEENLQEQLSTSANGTAVLLSTFQECTDVILRQNTSGSRSSMPDPLMVLVFAGPGLGLIITLYIIGRRIWKGTGFTWKRHPRGNGKTIKYFLYTGENVSPAVSLDNLSEPSTPGRTDAYEYT